MCLKQPNLSEQQEKDELNILYSIESLNTSFKRYNSDTLSPEVDCLSTQSTYGFDMSMILLKENFYAYDHTIKIMLIGNKSVGKTTFLNNILTRLNQLATDKTIAQFQKDNLKPTISLEIIKRLLKINNKIINLEFWDTNEQVLTSPIIKSNSNLTLAYMKICNSFILVCDPSSEASINFIERQMDNIIKFSINANLIMIGNKSRGVEKPLNDISERYNIPFCNMEAFGISMLEAYLNKSLASRSAEH
jgi:hypothetical protein